MEVESLGIPGLLLLTPRVFEDDRGYFFESYNVRTFRAAGVGAEFVQDNHSFSAARGTVRGLHYQAPSHAQGKLVRVLLGAVLDVAVDARVGSPTYGQHVSVTLSAANNKQLYIPEGFLHAFMTLEPNTHVAYKVTDFYSKDAEGAVIWNDPDLGIDWPIPPDQTVLSAKDADAMRWADFQSPFQYGK